MQLTHRFQEAFGFAFQLHQNHKRKGTEVPYISHLMSVAAVTLEYGSMEDEAIAALLHDAIEDQAENYGGIDLLSKEIEKRFGKQVLEIILGCSEADISPKPPWRERKESYIHHIHQASSSIRLVSMADKLHNARSILSDYRQVGEGLWQRFNASKEDTLWYYRSLVSAFHKADPDHTLVNELDRVVTEIEKAARDNYRPSCVT